MIILLHNCCNNNHPLASSGGGYLNLINESGQNSLLSSNYIILHDDLITAVMFLQTEHEKHAYACFLRFSADFETEPIIHFTMYMLSLLT